MRAWGLGITCTAVAILTAGCATLGFKNQKTLKPGQEVSAGGLWYYVNSDCKAIGQPKIKLISQSTRGTIRFSPDKGRPHFRPSNPLSKCNASIVDGTKIYYKAPSNYQGSDEIAFQVEWPNGATNYYGAKLLIE